MPPPPIGYNAGMGQFSLKRLFIAVTLIAIGIARIVVRPTSDLGSLMWPLGGAAVGAGALSLYRRPIIGAVAGAIIGMILQVLIAGSLIVDAPAH